MQPQNQLIDGITITPCEFDLIRHLMQGMTQKEIAATLNKKHATIATQMRALYLKTRICKLSGLVVWAAEHGFDSKGNYTPAEATNNSHPAQAHSRQANFTNSV